MLVEDISLSQIFTATLFIVALIAVQIYILKNKNKLKGKWAPNKRIQVTESTRLGPTEKLQLIKVDQSEFLYFFSKGNQPVIVQLNGSSNETTKKQAAEFGSHTNLTTKSNPKLIKGKTVGGTSDAPQTDSKIIQAISLARKQNPKVSFE